MGGVWVYIEWCLSGTVGVYGKDGKGDVKLYPQVGIEGYVR